MQLFQLFQSGLNEGFVVLQIDHYFTGFKAYILFPNSEYLNMSTTELTCWER